MNKERFEYLMTQYLRGKATLGEEKELASSIRLSDELHAAFRERTAGWTPDKAGDAETNRKWNRLASVIYPAEKEAEVPAIRPASSKRMVWLSIAAAAVITCVSGISLFFFRQGESFGTETDRQWQTVVAGKDESTCILPDGTSVVLRRGASLSYPNKFSGSVRQVSIRGEAFFDVKPNARKPFVVDASKLFVKVLGTSFGIRAQDHEETISVTLVEGSVSLNDTHEKEVVRLQPNQKADYSRHSGHCVVSQVDSERLTSWRKGIIMYDNASLDEVVRLIELTYNVSLQYTQPTGHTQRFSGAFLKTQKLETVLELTGRLTGVTISCK